MYGAGLRLTEALHLRVKDIDFEIENQYCPRRQRLLKHNNAYVGYIAKRLEIIARKIVQSQFGIAA